VTSNDFHDWKRHPVTQEVFSQLQGRVADSKDQLVGLSRDRDDRAAYVAGIIDGFQFLLNIDFEDAHGN
jgi:hypothetical protein